MPAKGGRQSPEAREAIRAAHKGRERTPEHRANLTASLRGRKMPPRSEETKRKIKEALIGRKRTPEQVERNRISHLGQPSARKGVVLSDETKEKIRQARAIQGNPKMNLRGITQAQMDEATSNGMRWCAGQCKAFIPIDRFYNGGDTKRTVCSECGIGVNRNQAYKKYGVSAEWYEQTLAAQGGKCALCPAEFGVQRSSGGWDRRKKGRLAIDHDHDLGHARGLLCGRCNLALHRVEYVKGWAQRAVEYLRYHGSESGKDLAIINADDVPDPYLSVVV